MAEWMPIETAPDRPMPVLYFRGNLMFWESDPEKSYPAAPSDAEPYRDERYDIGFWDGDAWCDNGTGHECFEFDDDAFKHFQPTHWQPLPEPPK